MAAAVSRRSFAGAAGRDRGRAAPARAPSSARPLAWTPGSTPTTRYDRWRGASSTSASPTAPWARRKKTTCGTWSRNLGVRRRPRAHRPVPDVEAHARLLPVVRGACPAARVPGAGRARRRQDGRGAAMRRARLAAAPRRFGRRQPDLRLGGWANPHGERRRPGRLPARCPRPRRLLPDADRLASRARPRRGVRERGRPPRPDPARRLRGLLLSQRQARRRCACCASSCRCRSTP